MGLTNNFKCIIRTDLHGKWINLYSYRLNHVVATTDITFGGGGQIRKRLCKKCPKTTNFALKLILLFSVITESRFTVIFVEFRLKFFNSRFVRKLIKKKLRLREFLRKIIKTTIKTSYSKPFLKYDNDPFRV